MLSLCNNGSFQSNIFVVALRRSETVSHTANHEHDFGHVTTATQRETSPPISCDYAPLSTIGHWYSISKERARAVCVSHGMERFFVLALSPVQYSSNRERYSASVPEMAAFGTCG